jgi:hypothetical protein
MDWAADWHLRSTPGKTGAALVTVTAVDLSQKILFAHILSKSRNLCEAKVSLHEWSH